MSEPFDLEDMRYYADRHRGKHILSGPHWSLVLRFPILFDQYEKALTRAETAEAEVNRLREVLEEVKVNRDIAWETINRQGGTVDIAMSRLNVCGRIADTALKGGE